MPTSPASQWVSLLAALVLWGVGGVDAFKAPTTTPADAIYGKYFMNLPEITDGILNFCVTTQDVYINPARLPVPMSPSLTGTTGVGAPSSESMKFNAQYTGYPYPAIGGCTPAPGAIIRPLYYLTGGELRGIVQRAIDKMQSATGGQWGVTLPATTMMSITFDAALELEALIGYVIGGGPNADASMMKNVALVVDAVAEAWNNNTNSAASGVFHHPSSPAVPVPTSPVVLRNLLPIVAALNAKLVLTGTSENPASTGGSTSTLAGAMTRPALGSTLGSTSTDGSTSITASPTVDVLFLRTDPNALDGRGMSEASPLSKVSPYARPQPSWFAPSAFPSLWWPSVGTYQLSTVTAPGTGAMSVVFSTSAVPPPVGAPPGSMYLNAAGMTVIGLNPVTGTGVVGNRVVPEDPKTQRHSEVWASLTRRAATNRQRSGLNGAKRTGGIRPNTVPTFGRLYGSQTDFTMGVNQKPITAADVNNAAANYPLNRTTGGASSGVSGASPSMEMPSCLFRSVPTCLPLGGLSVWGTTRFEQPSAIEANAAAALRPTTAAPTPSGTATTTTTTTTTTSAPTANMGSFNFTTRMTTRSIALVSMATTNTFFQQDAPAANTAVSGMVALLAIAEALGRPAPGSNAAAAGGTGAFNMMASYLQNVSAWPQVPGASPGVPPIEPIQVYFYFFAGEEHGLTGSGRFVMETGGIARFYADWMNATNAAKSTGRDQVDGDVSGFQCLNPSVGANIGSAYSCTSPAYRSTNFSSVDWSQFQHILVLDQIADVTGSGNGLYLHTEQSVDPSSAFVASMNQYPQAKSASGSSPQGADPVPSPSNAFFYNFSSCAAQKDLMEKFSSTGNVQMASTATTTQLPPSSLFTFLRLAAIKNARLDNRSGTAPAGGGNNTSGGSGGGVPTAWEGPNGAFQHTTLSYLSSYDNPYFNHNAYQSNYDAVDPSSFPATSGSSSSGVAAGNPFAPLDTNRIRLASQSVLDVLMLLWREDWAWVASGYTSRNWTSMMATTMTLPPVLQPVSGGGGGGGMNAVLNSLRINQTYIDTLWYCLTVNLACSYNLNTLGLTGLMSASTALSATQAAATADGSNYWMPPRSYYPSVFAYYNNIIVSQQVVLEMLSFVLSGASDSTVYALDVPSGVPTGDRMVGRSGVNMSSYGWTVAVTSSSSTSATTSTSLLLSPRAAGAGGYLSALLPATVASPLVPWVLPSLPNWRPYVTANCVCPRNYHCRSANVLRVNNDSTTTIPTTSTSLNGAISVCVPRRAWYHHSFSHMASYVVNSDPIYFAQSPSGPYWLDQYGMLTFTLAEQGIAAPTGTGSSGTSAPPSPPTTGAVVHGYQVWTESFWTNDIGGRLLAIEPDAVSWLLLGMGLLVTIVITAAGIGLSRCTFD